MRGQLYKLQDFLSDFFKRIVAALIVLLPAGLLLLMVSILLYETTVFRDIYFWLGKNAADDYDIDNKLSTLGRIQVSLAYMIQFTTRSVPAIEDLWNLESWKFYLPSFMAAFLAVALLKDKIFKLVFVALLMGTIAIPIVVNGDRNSYTLSEQVADYAFLSWWWLVYRVTIIGFYLGVSALLFDYLQGAVKLIFSFITHRKG